MRRDRDIPSLATPDSLDSFEAALGAMLDEEKPPTARTAAETTRAA